MVLRISSKLHHDLLALATASPEFEICGLLVGSECVEHIIATDNVAPDPRRSFEIHPTILFAAIRTERAGGDKVLGYYHSHPTGPPVPSVRDHAQATSDNRIWVIVADGRATAWSLDSDKMFKEVMIDLID